MIAKIDKERVDARVADVVVPEPVVLVVPIIISVGSAFSGRGCGVGLVKDVDE